MHPTNTIPKPATEVEVLIIGVGNSYRGDDAVGINVARCLSDRIPSGVAVLEHDGELTTLREAWRDADKVILIDAVYSGSKPGTIYRFDMRKEKTPSNFFVYSTHDLNLAYMIELYRTLGQLPPNLIFFGIEGESFDDQVGLSEAVEGAVEEVVKHVLEELQRR